MKQVCSKPVTQARLRRRLGMGAPLDSGSLIALAIGGAHLPRGEGGAPIRLGWAVGFNLEVGDGISISRVARTQVKGPRSKREEGLERRAGARFWEVGEGAGANAQDRP